MIPGQRLLGWAPILLAALLSLQGSQAQAQEWTPTGQTGGDVFEADLSSVTRTDNVVHSWVRQRLAQPKKDAAGKQYSTAMYERFDDCTGRKFRLGSDVLYDKAGRVVGSDQGGTNWQDIVPGTVTESSFRILCKATEANSEKPILESISGEGWVPLGPSADGKFTLSVLLDRVIKVDDTRVIVATRSDASNFEFLNGLPVRHVLNLTVIDCRASTSALLATDAYMSWSHLAQSIRNPIEKLELQPLVPGSFLYNSRDRICAAAKASDQAAQNDSAASNVASGTGWGVTKGYIVTASHVVTDAKKISVYRDGERIGLAQVVVNDPANDLALLKFVGGQRIDVLPLADKAPPLGRNVFTLGYPAPDVLGQRLKMTAGQVSGTAGIQDDARFLQISLPVQPGNSGGPVLNWDGQVVGVVEARLKEDAIENKAELVNLAVKASYIRPLLDELPDLGGYQVVHATTADGLIAAASRAVFMLVVEE